MSVCIKYWVFGHWYTGEWVCEVSGVCCMTFSIHYYVMMVSVLSGCVVWSTVKRSIAAYVFGEETCLHCSGSYLLSTWFSTYSWIVSTPHSVPVYTSCT